MFWLKILTKGIEKMSWIIAVVFIAIPYGEYLLYRHVSRSENLGGRVVLGGDNVPPLVKIGLTDLPKTGGAYAPPASPFDTCLSRENSNDQSENVAQLFFLFRSVSYKS